MGGPGATQYADEEGNVAAAPAPSSDSLFDLDPDSVDIDPDYVE